eukprot:3037918-Prymnesium_polylepis.1
MLAEAGWRVVERTLARRGGERALPVREAGRVPRPMPQLCERRDAVMVMPTALERIAVSYTHLTLPTICSV